MTSPGGDAARDAADGALDGADGALDTDESGAWIPGDVYTHGHHDSVLRSHRWRTAENSAAYLLGSLRPGQRLLDVGCGPGTLTCDLARRVAPGEVIGIDVSAEVVAEATATAVSQGVTNVRFVAGDFRSPGVAREGFDVGSFDVVHAHQVLQHLREPVDALAAMATLARPGGVVAARDADYGAMFWSPEVAGLDHWLALYRGVARHNGAEPDAGRCFPAWADAAGLGQAVVTTSTWTYASGEERGWWSDVWAARIVSSAMAGQALAYGMATEADLARIAAAWVAWGREPHGIFVIPHGELLAHV